VERRHTAIQCVSGISCGEPLEFFEDEYSKCIVPKRICANCGVPKPITEFWRQNFKKPPLNRNIIDWKNARKYECKSCEVLKRRLRYQKKRLNG
jgi:hypothetical protein